MGGIEAHEPTRLVAGGVDVAVAGHGAREPEGMADRAGRTSSSRTRPGRIGRPAASALVQPAGRSALERRFQVAPQPAVQRPPGRSAAKSS